MSSTVCVNKGRTEETIFGNVLKLVLSFLQAQRWNYQTAHWQTRGGGFYGDHLMFQRLYEGLDGEIDTLAEKIVGSLGGDPFDSLDQSQKSTRWLESWAVYDCPFRRGLQSEKDFQIILKTSYQVLKQHTTMMSLGLDDWIMSTASAHETNLYLLQQRMSHMGTIRKASQELTRLWFSVPSFSRGREFHAAEDKESD